MGGWMSESTPVMGRLCDVFLCGFHVLCRCTFLNLFHLLRESPERFGLVDHRSIQRLRQLLQVRQCGFNVYQPFVVAVAHLTKLPSSIPRVDLKIESSLIIVN